MATVAVKGRPAGRTRTKAKTSRPKSVRPSGYVLLLVLVAVLNIIGLVMVLSASSVEALRLYGSAWFYFERQILWVGLGTAALIVTLRIDYHRWRKLAVPLLLACGAMLLAVLVPGIGIRVNGSARWLGAGQWRVQPSELAKLAVLIFIADLLTRRSSRMDDTRYVVWPVMAAFLSVGLLIMMEPDMGTTLVLGSIVFGVLFVAGAPLFTMAKIGGMAAVGSLGLAVLEPYRWRRMTAFRHPFADAGNAGYQSAQGLLALGSGKLTGVGLGASRASWGFLPNPHTDFIFAIIGEQTGLVGSLLVISLFGAFAFLGVRAALRAPDRFGMLIAAGITSWIIGQAVINVGAVVGLLPVTGVPLPFISFGGSSLVIAMGAVGILLNVARSGRP
jgi:cell division protein FtsW